MLTLGVRRSVRTHQAGSDAARDDADAAWTVSVEAGSPSSYFLLLLMMVGESFKDLTPKVQWKFVITKRNNDREKNYLRYSEIFGILKFVVLKFFYI